MKVEYNCASKVKISYEKSELISVRKDTNYLKPNEKICKVVHDLSLNKKRKKNEAKEVDRNQKQTLA